MSRCYVQVHRFVLVLELRYSGGLDGALQPLERDVGRPDVLGEQLELALVELDLDRAVQHVFLERVFRCKVHLHVVVAAGVVLGEPRVRRESRR